MNRLRSDVPDGGSVLGAIKFMPVSVGVDFVRWGRRSGRPAPVRPRKLSASRRRSRRHERRRAGRIAGYGLAGLDKIGEPGVRPGMTGVANSGRSIWLPKEWRGYRERGSRLMTLQRQPTANGDDTGCLAVEFSRFLRGNGLSASCWTVAGKSQKPAGLTDVRVPVWMPDRVSGKKIV